VWGDRGLFSQANEQGLAKTRPPERPVPARSGRTASPPDGGGGLPGRPAAPGRTEARIAIFKASFVGKPLPDQAVRPRAVALSWPCWRTTCGARPAEAQAGTATGQVEFEGGLTAATPALGSGKLSGAWHRSDTHGGGRTLIVFRVKKPEGMTLHGKMCSKTAVWPRTRNF